MTNESFPSGKQGVLYKCRITRDRKGMDRGLYPIYYLHLERDTGKKVFLLAGELVIIALTNSINYFQISGRKRKKSKTSNYVVSADPTDLSRQTDGFVGKLRSNVFGTTFFMYDHGVKNNIETPRLDLGVVIYVSLILARIERLISIPSTHRTQTFWDSKGLAT